jgi:hypothetical protein
VRVTFPVVDQMDRRAHRESFSRISMATIPCPGAGTQTDEGTRAEMRDDMRAAANRLPRE